MIGFRLLPTGTKPASLYLNGGKLTSDKEELQTAHTLQMGLMPTEPPQIEGFDITGRCIPANHVGCDFYQYFQQDGKLSVCMADVRACARIR